MVFINAIKIHTKVSQLVIEIVVAYLTPGILIIPP